MKVSTLHYVEAKIPRVEEQIEGVINVIGRGFLRAHGHKLPLNKEQIEIRINVVADIYRSEKDLKAKRRSLLSLDN